MKQIANMQINAKIMSSKEKYYSADAKLKKIKTCKQWTGLVKAGIYIRAHTYYKLVRSDAASLSSLKLRGIVVPAFLRYIIGKEFCIICAYN